VISSLPIDINPAPGVLIFNCGYAVVVFQPFKVKVDDEAASAIPITAVPLLLLIDKEVEKLATVP
jgi:hypothetical protein